MTNEFAVLVALCRPAPDATEISRRLADTLDSQELLRLIARHRVAGLAHRGIVQSGVALPDALATPIASAARDIAHTGLVMAAETLRLCRALSDSGLPVLVLKGAPLAILAHRTLGTKMAWDIDLLILQRDLVEAANVLVAAGYVRVEPGAAVPIERWHRFAKDSAWRHSARGIMVELHTALTESPRFLLRDLDARSASQLVEVSPGMTLPTLATDPLFAYLSVHGALSGWRRLKWLADFAGTIVGVDNDELGRRHDVAIAIGAGRAPAMALALSARVFGTPLPDRVKREIAGNAVLRAIINSAYRLMTNPKGFDAPAETLFGTLPMHAIAALLMPGLPYAANELRRRLRRDPRGGWLPYTLATLIRRSFGADEAVRGKIGN